MTLEYLPRWEVVLIGDTTDLDHLVRYFNTEAVKFYKDETTSETRMWLNSFETDTDVQRVKELARAKLKALSGALRVALDARRPLQLGTVSYKRIDGTRHIYSEFEARVCFTSSFEAEVLKRDANGILTLVPSPPPRSVYIARLADSDALAAKLLRYSLMHDAETWTGLYRTVDALTSQLAGKNWVSQARLERFKRTANSSAAGDASRHGHERHPPPPDPMTLHEGRQFVQELRDKWLDWMIESRLVESHHRQSDRDGEVAGAMM